MSNIISKITTLLNRVVDIVSSGSLERVRIIKEFNLVFNEAYQTGDLDKWCSVTTGAGNQQYKHELSSFYLRSGFKITIHNDLNLQENDFYEISKYVIESAPFVRQLMALGYDTLIVVGKNTGNGVQISLKQIANLHDYMLNNNR
jgi:hypothetical protein